MKNKVIIITGASSGIGKALVYRLAKQGAMIMMAARNVDTMIEISSELKNINPNIEYIKTDVSIETDCQKLIDTTIEKFGKIDVLINNAGISMRALFKDVHLDVLKSLMDVNFWGTVYCSKFAIEHIIKQKGTIVGVSSVAGKKGLPGRAGYSASKFAMEGFLDVIRIENLKNGMNVLTVCPGFTASNIRNTALGKDGSFQKETPLDEAKLMSAEEVADKTIDAIIKRKKSIVLTTQGKLTYIINKFFPRLTDKLVFNHFAKEKNSPLNNQ